MLIVKADFVKYNKWVKISPQKQRMREKRHKGSIEYGKLVNKVEKISQEVEQRRLQNRRENIRKLKDHFFRFNI